MSTPASPAKKPTEKKPRAPPTHPKYDVMVKDALVKLKDKKGSSQQAVVKFIKANYTVSDGPQVSRAANAALKKMVEDKTATQEKSSFKLAAGEGASDKKPAKKDAKSPKSPAAKKAKPAKATTPAKSPAKKTPAKK